MALDQGLGGGIRYTGPSLITPWWDEEERKRKEQLGIAGAPKAPSGSSKPVSEQSRGEFVSVVNQVTQAKDTRFTSQQTGKRMDTLEEFYSLAGQVGEKSLAKRMADITAIWQSYMPTINGRDSIWELVTSPYSLDYIEEMCRQAGNAAYIAPWDNVGGTLRDLQNQAVEKEVKENRYNPNDPYGKLAIMAGRTAGYATPGHSGIEKIGNRLADFFGLARNDDGSINWGWSGVGGAVVKFPVEHPTEFAATPVIAAATVASGGAAAAPLLGAAETGAGAYLSALAGSRVFQAGVTGAAALAGMETFGAANEQLGAEVGAARAAEKAVQLGDTAAGSYLLGTYANMSTLAYRADEATASDIQRSLQEGDRDAYGNVLPGTQYGTDLKITGAWDDNWDYALRQAVTAKVSRNIERQRELMERGYAESYFTIDGNMDTDQWRKAEYAALQDQIAKDRARADDPVAYAKSELRGLPTTGAGWRALINRTKAEGLFQFPLKAMLTAIGLLGGTYNAEKAALVYDARCGNDETYQSRRSELVEYLKNSGQYSDYQVSMLMSRKAFLSDEIHNGKLRDDAEAQRLYGSLQQRSMQILASGFEPSTMELVGNLLGFPGEKVTEFKENNRDLDLALNLISDIGVAVGSGKVLREIKKGRPIVRDAAAFRTDARAITKTQEVINWLRKEKPGQVESVIKGSDAPALARTLQEAYVGRNTQGGFWRNLAHDIRRDIDAGDTVAAAEKLERSGVKASEAQAAVTKAQAAYDPQLPAARNINKMASALAKEQKTTKGLLDLERAVGDHLANGYASGMSIFPYFHAPQMAGGGLYAMAQRSWHNMVSGIENPVLKTFLERNTLKFNTRAPVERQEYTAQESSSRIFEAAYAASDGSIDFALRMRDRWVMSRSERQMDSIAQTIADEANKNFKLDHTSKGGQNNVSLSVNAATGETSPVLADTGQAAYKAAFKDARASIWAPHNLDALTGADKIFTQVVRNPYRALGRGLKAINNPLRTLTVGFPLLFTKHAFTDSTRTLIEEGPRAFADAFRKSKSFEESLAELSPEVSNAVRANLHKAKMSEQHYNVGQDGTTQSFSPRKIYEVNEKGEWKPANMDEGVEALRRIAIGKVFEAYARDGLQGVADFLFTKEGRKFLHESGNAAMTKAFLEEIGLDVREVFLPEEGMATVRGAAITERTGTVYQRWDTQEASISDVNKPQGLYLSPDDVVSPHAGEGLVKTEYVRNPNANVLKFIDTGKNKFVVMRKGTTSAGAGVWAARKLLGRYAFDKLKNLSHEEFVRWAKEQWPDVDWAKAVDSQEIMEQVGGLLARKAGFDAIELVDKIAPEFTEFVALNESAVSIRKPSANTPDTGGPLLTGDVRMMPAGTRKITGQEFMQSAVADYLQRFGMGYLEALDVTAPQIAAGLKEMALNKVPMTQKNIKALVERVNSVPGAPLENPWLSIADDPSLSIVRKYVYGKGGKGFKGIVENTQSAAANRTAAFMTPNKWNREVLYKASFDRFYKDMKKQGFDPDTSAKVAMDLAELETTRVHFDLANGLYFETQNRWFAWFGTKHRLYNTYLTKMVTERPSIAGAAQTLLDYLEDKNNEDPNASEWDKHTLFFDLPDWIPGVKPGDRWGMNPATIVWLADYPIESTTANVFKIAGAEAFNTAVGKKAITQGFGDFGFSTGRYDGIVLTSAVAVASYIAMRTANDEQKVDSKWLVDFFNTSDIISDRVRKRISKGMAMAQFEAVGRGEEITPEQAFKKSMLGALVYEYMQLGKPLSGRLYTATEGKSNALMKEYDKVPVEQRSEWLTQHPEVTALFGMYGKNPAEQMIIDRGWNILNKAKDRKTQAYEQAFADGTIFDPAVVKGIEAEWNTAIERLTDEKWRDETGEPAPEYNQAFAKVWGESGYDKFTREQGINILFPWVDAKAVAQSGYIPTQQQQADEATRLTALYDQRRDSLGWEGLATNSPALHWLKNDMVTEPMRKFTKNVAEGDYPWASRREENIATILARGEAGPMKQTAYLNEVYLRDQMAAYAAGTDSRAKKGVTMSAPLFSKMTTEEKADIGWSSDKSAEYIWRRWAMQKAIQQIWMKQNGVSASSTKAKAMATALDEWAVQQGESDKYFKAEYEFAKKPLHERLQELGVGTTGKKSDQGWQEFFSLVTSYHADLATVKKGGVSPQAQAAAPVTRAYLEEILALKDREKEWWQEFSQMYTPSKFGFYWRLEDSRDAVLFGGEEQDEYDEAYDYEVL